MRKLIIILGLSLFIVSTCYLMSNNPGNEIPKPKENFKAKITDIDNVYAEGYYISYNGKTYISAKKGSIQVYIPFEQIQSLNLSDNREVITQEKKEILGILELKNGHQEHITISPDDEITGQAAFGQFRIKLAYLKQLVFLKKLSEEENKNIN